MWQSKGKVEKKSENRKRSGKWDVMGKEKWIP